MGESVERLRKQLEKYQEKLQASEAHFRNIIERNADGIVIVDRAGIVRFANSAAGALWDCKAEALLDKPFGFPLVAGETVETDLIRIPGESVTVEMRVVMTEWDGQTAYLASLRDITERKRAESALRDSQQRLKTLLDFVQVGIVTVDADTRQIVDANPAALQMIGASGEEVIGSICHKFICPAEWGRCPVCDLGQTVDSSERILLTASGEAVPILKNVVMMELGDHRYMLENFVSIAEQKQAEEEVRHRNRELALFNRIIAASAGANLKPEAMLEIACRELAQTFDLPVVLATLLNEERTAAVVVAEYRANNEQSALNTTMPVEDNKPYQQLLTRKQPLALTGIQLRQDELAPVLVIPLTVGGEVIGSLDLRAVKPRLFRAHEVSLARSVADQVAGGLAQAQLTQERQRLSAAIEQTADSVVITDTAGTILYVNPAFERITGYNRSEVLGENLRILKSGQQKASFYQELWEIITVGGIWHGRFINKKKDGDLYTVDATITPVRDESGSIFNYVGVERDVTRELELEEQSRQSQKMEAVGLLAGGIAHDFNNLLTAINGFAELLQNHMSAGDPLREYPEKILKSGRRAADLVGQLLAFSRKQVIEPSVLDLNAVVKDMNKMLARVIGEHIQIEMKLESGLWPVRADLAQLEQVVVNLAVNARDAMPEGGELIIETGNVPLDGKYAAGRLEMEAGEYVLLAVTDSGIGMSEEIKAHLFEPFFTTKSVGRGTGLGLATVFGIVKQNGGHVEVDSREGQGSTFKVYLPAVQKKPDDFSPSRPIGVTKMPGGSETILLVEDNSSVLDLAGQVLTALGYRVLSAKDGQEALQLCASHTGPLHLLLTDVIMPGMSGKALADQLAKKHPGLKFLFVSGYVDNLLMRRGMLEPGIAFLQKPFSPVVLAFRVREVLDAA